MVSVFFACSMVITLTVPDDCANGLKVVKREKTIMMKMTSVFFFRTNSDVLFIITGYNRFQVLYIS